MSVVFVWCAVLIMLEHASRMTASPLGPSWPALASRPCARVRVVNFTAPGEYLVDAAGPVLAELWGAGDVCTGAGGAAG